MKKYLFLDRDGTLIHEPVAPDIPQIDTVEKFKLLKDVIPALLRFRNFGYNFVMVSNQDALGTQAYPKEKFQLIQELLLGIFSTQGITFEAIRVCPHTESDQCKCRKPALSLVQDYVALPELDRSNSFVIGDRPSDLMLAQNMGIGGLLITQEFGWKEITTTLLDQPRTASLSRKTGETEILVKLDLDNYLAKKSTGQITTGIGFFDHMLEQLCYHSGIAASIKVVGDLHIDDHHTVEDTAIALGTALRQALGEKLGIGRYGFYLPMDEASAQVAIDLSGRSYFRFEGVLGRDSIGGMSKEMIPHFFRSFSEGLGASLHIKLEGENTHHQIEAAFKAVGRSLRSAISRQDSQTGKTGRNEIPSTKGIL